ncbi:type IV secretion system DNA-binding domain-containing protein [Micromonospora aurantiaca]|uniref:type IV secretion system DNA-binding domain-containing protein n=1 Tax=Micromonospora aurantiaca (nom. illeg.) TaxID=47850 RepID=UPI0008278CAE|nr:type IV secretion system DNA-binding domain-containing protein [Micromonospora aurantiaca]SCL32805.1 AAA-like domain-containing protein [Micromonospora aurantiaca]
MTPPLALSPAPAPSPSGPGAGVILPPAAPTRWVLHAVDWAVDRPWLVSVAATLLVVYVAGRNLVDGWRHRRHADRARLVTVAPPPEVDPHSAAALWANLHGTLTPSGRRRLLYGSPHVVWQYTWTGRRLLISIWVPGSVLAGAVEAAVRAAWPGAACTTDDPAPPPIPLDVPVAVGGQLLPAAAEWLPLRTDHANDPLRALMSAGSQLKPDEYACVQVLARPATLRRGARARRAAGRLRDGKTAVPVGNPAGPLLWLIEVFQAGSSARSRAGSAGAAPRRDPGVERDVRAILDKTNHPLWTIGVRYAVAKNNRRGGSRPRARLQGIADAVASSFAVYAGRNRLTRRARMGRPVAVLAARRLGAGFLACTPELAVLAALPRDLAVPGLDRARAKSMPAPVAVPAGGRGVKVLGDAEVGGHAVALPVADARYHLHVVGSTGSGKTTLLVNMAVDDITAGRGTVVIDPHGDMVLDILDRLPASVAGRVVLFDPDQPNPPTLNPLSGTDPDLVVDNLVSIFGTIFAKAWGPRMDDVMRVACLTLLRHANVTLQHIPPLLNSAQFRSAMTVGLDDPAGLSGFWQWYDQLNPALRSQVIGPVLARLRAFLLRDFVKRTMRYPQSSFDMGKVLDGGALLVRIPKGQLGEDTSKLLGSLVLAQVWQAATARASVPADRRRDATLIIDECQNFLTLANSLDSMLAEARKYRLSMVLAHQDLAQFPKDLLAAASANARNKLYFSVAPEDARVLARHTLPELDEHDLTHLDAYTAAGRLVVGGRQTPAFTLKTRPPKPVVGEATAIRQAAAEAVPAQDTSAIDDLVDRFSARPDDNRRSRGKSAPKANT